MTKLVVRHLEVALIAAALTLGCGCKRSSPAQKLTHHLTIAAAADLKFALDDLAAEFRQRHTDIEVQITYGSSGNFYSQLVSKAPFDLFLCADVSYVDKLIDGGLAVRDSKFVYAIGQIVLWVPKDSPLDVSKLGLSSLAEPSVKKVAIANPQHAPYGRAAEAALKTHDLWDKVREKLVLGENVAQTAQFVQSGSVDAGIIALSLARSPKMAEAGHYFVIPQTDYPRLEQAGAILSWAQDRAAANDFRQFIMSPKGKQTLARYGFALP